MRRILLIALATSGVAVAVPAAASAHHHAGSSARHERLHHHGRHHTRFVHFASRSSVTSTTTTGTGTPPAGSPGEAVGTIASFEGGVLKITLNDGTTVSGTVTDGTEIKCGTPAATMSDRNGGPGPSDSSGHDNGQGEDNEGQGHDEGQGDDQGEGDDEGHGPETTPACGPTALVAGAKVQEAELKLSGAQSTWESVELAG